MYRVLSKCQELPLLLTCSILLNSFRLHGVLLSFPSRSLGFEGTERVCNVPEAQHDIASQARLFWDLLCKPIKPLFGLKWFKLDFCHLQQSTLIGFLSNLVCVFIQRAPTMWYRIIRHHLTAVSGTLLPRNPFPLNQSDRNHCRVAPPLKKKYGLQSQNAWIHHISCGNLGNLLYLWFLERKTEPTSWLL